MNHNTVNNKYVDTIIENWRNKKNKVSNSFLHKWQTHLRYSITKIYMKCTKRTHYHLRGKSKVLVHRENVRGGMLHPCDRPVKMFMISHGLIAFLLNPLYLSASPTRKAACGDVPRRSWTNANGNNWCLLV